MSEKFQTSATIRAPSGFEVDVSAGQLVHAPAVVETMGDVKTHHALPAVIILITEPWAEGDACVMEIVTQAG